MNLNDADVDDATLASGGVLDVIGTFATFICLVEGGLEEAGDLVSFTASRGSNRSLVASGLLLLVGFG